ncbi:cationic amino acid ABC transporter, periplasmic binding protein [Pseudogulbenkiania sp. NH8B]|uniref:ABC transporter substrate-binding protein n=1 Tax=Pseudogulbenkiania sp. (strain NH8B) TaxID=748280 RepID=UPI00022798D7|nr:ABC transporter substrate-binding protein [Pseudogulbenkiania sp. NH8B]BAK76799.1 cationic amino acid ABC transporter, periplasmic binding protein [Pseudogulbenkiania sp. NH8B]
MKKLTVALTLALAAGSVYAKDWTVIRFGIDPSYAPFESKAPDGKLVGFDIDIGNAICTKLKARCEWVENAWDGIIPALKAKKFDAILSSMSVTEKRQQQIAFSDKIYHTPTRLIARKGAALATLASLKGKRIGVEQGSTQEAYAKKYWEPSNVTVVPYQNQDLVYQDLQSGRLDAALQDAVQADMGFLKTPRGHDYAFVGPALNDTQTLGVGAAIGLRKEDQDLRQKINKAIADIHKDGTYQKIENKYFGFDVYN